MIFDVLCCVLFSGIWKSKGYVELGIDININIYIYINISLHLSQRLATISSPSQEIALVFSSIEAGQLLDSSDKQCIPKLSNAAIEIQDCAQGMSLQSWAHSEHGLSEACSLHALKAQALECSSIVQKETAVLGACFSELSGHWRSSTVYPFSRGGPF